MVGRNLTSELLYLYNSVVFTIDQKKSLVKELYSSSALVAKNISYLDLAHKLAEIYSLKDIFADKIDRFFTNLNISERTFFMNLDYVGLDESKTTFMIRGYKINDSEFIIAYYPLIINNIGMDELTKTVNKNKIISYLKDLLNKKKESICIKLGIDRFLDIVNEKGSLFGDIILIKTASSIKNIINNNGLISRIALSEFAIILEIKDDYDIIYRKLKEIREIIEELSIFNSKEIITTTIGCTRCPSDAKDLNEVIQKTELAYGRAIKKGHDSFVIYTEEKCGKIPNDYKTQFYNSTVPIPVQNSTYNITAGIIRLLDQNEEIDFALNEALSIVGNYFLLDRICYLRENLETKKLETLVWYNQNNIVPLPNKLVSNENYLKWLKYADTSNMIKLNQVESNKTCLIYDDLKESKTSSILSFVLEYNKEKLGLLNFEMCSTNRFWSRDEISALRVISNIFAIKTYKTIENNNHYNDLYIDSITGLYNYKKWYLEISDILRDDPKTIFSIIQIQIADFYNLRTLMSSNKIDELYKTIANKLKSYSDLIICHDQDDRFLIFIKTTDENIVKNIFEDLSNYIFNNSPDKKYKLNLIGGSYINIYNDPLSKAVDKTQIASKNSISGITFYDNNMHELEKNRTRLELHMYDALKDNEFLLYLQPKINSETNELIGAEALTRWFFYHQRLIFPNEFIPIFEENGFIEELDYNVFENVCKFLRYVLNENKDAFPISINVSRYITDFKEYLKTINKIKEKYNIPTNLLEIEITEGMFYDNDNKIKEFIDMLHESGYKVLMDDFGSGYSSISSLANLNFDCIKIDKSLAEKNSEKNKIIVSSLIQMIKNLNMDVICEGVETIEYKDFLKTVGCTTIQGYLYDKPLPLDDFKNKYLK